MQSLDLLKRLSLRLYLERFGKYDYTLMSYPIQGLIIWLLIFM